MAGIELTIQYVGAGGFGDCGDLGNQAGGDAKFGEALAEELNDCVEVGIVETALYEVGMTTAQVLACVMNRAAEGHCEEGLLFGDLGVHIDAFKEMADAVVGKDLPIEDIYSGFNGRATTELFVKIVHGNIMLYLACIF